MTYRQLPVSEWPLLGAHFDSRHVPLPDPRLSTIFAAFDDSNTLQAFLVCQLKLHTEPLVSFNPLAIPGLLRHAEDSLIQSGFSGVEWYVATTSDRVAGVAENFGFHKAEPVYVRRLSDSVKVP
jgi:hypothetical protein